MIVTSLERTLPKVVQKKTQEIKTRSRFSPEIVPVARRSSAPDQRERKEYEERVFAAQKKVRDCQYRLYKRTIPLAIVFEGRDAAGKGGTIMRLTYDLNPRGYRVMPVAAPNDHEKGHHYLWRFIMNYPNAGHITIYDRGWYGWVLVERVEGLCTKPEWKRAYTEINEMEEEFRNWGGGLLKFWLEVSPGEQLGVSGSGKPTRTSSGRSPKRTGKTGRNGTFTERQLTRCLQRQARSTPRGR